MSEFLIQSQYHRENVVVALAMAGYSVRIERRKSTPYKTSADQYWVVVDLQRSEEEE